MSSIQALIAFGAVPLTAALYSGQELSKTLYLTLCVTAISTTVWGIFAVSGTRYVRWGRWGARRVRRWERAPIVVR